MPKIKVPDMECYFIEGLKCKDDCMSCDVIVNYLGFEPRSHDDIEKAVMKKMSDDLKKQVFGG